MIDAEVLVESKQWKKIIRNPKRIILNTLIGEKLFSMDFNLEHLPKEIDTYLIGRKKHKSTPT